MVRELTQTKAQVDERGQKDMIAETTTCRRHIGTDDATQESNGHINTPASLEVS